MTCDVRVATHALATSARGCLIALRGSHTSAAPYVGKRRLALYRHRAAVPFRVAVTLRTPDWASNGDRPVLNEPQSWTSWFVNIRVLKRRPQSLGLVNILMLFSCEGFPSNAADGDEQEAGRRVA